MTEIAIWQPGEIATPAQVPNSQLDDWIMVADKVARLADMICRSPFVPDGLRGSVPATAAAILTGRELGIPPMTSLANIHVIHGKPGLSALVMRALVMREGHEWEDVEVNNARVVLRGRRKGSATWTTASFSTADAQTAKLQLGNYPQDKLYARASARLARRAFADVIAGMPYSIEELEDGVTPDEDGTAAEAAPAAPPADKPRTAQRAARKTSPPAQAATAPAAPAPAPQGAGGDLPPLPGEDEPAPDETDHDTPGTVTTPQLQRIWITLKSEYEFGDDERDAARAVAARIVNRPLTSSKDLSFNEAKAVIDTLANWAATAKARSERPRDLITEVQKSPGDPRDAVLASLERLGVTGAPAIASILTRLSGKTVASAESLTRQQAAWFAERLAGIETPDELEAAAVAAEEARSE